MYTRENIAAYLANQRLFLARCHLCEMYYTSAFSRTDLCMTCVDGIVEGAARAKAIAEQNAELAAQAEEAEQMRDAFAMDAIIFPPEPSDAMVLHGIHPHAEDWHNDCDTCQNEFMEQGLPY